MIVGGQTEARAQLSSTIMSRLTRALVFIRIKLLVLGFRQCKGTGNSVFAQNNSKYHDSGLLQVNMWIPQLPIQ